MSCPYNVYSHRLLNGKSNQAEIIQNGGCWYLGNTSNSKSYPLQIKYLNNKLRIQATPGTVYYQINPNQPYILNYPDPKSTVEESTIIVGNTFFTVTQLQHGFGILKMAYIKGEANDVPIQAEATVHTVGKEANCSIVLDKDDDVGGTVMELSYKNSNYQVRDISKSNSTGVWIPFKSTEFDGSCLYLRVDNSTIISIKKNDKSNEESPTEKIINSGFYEDQKAIPVNDKVSKEIINPGFYDDQKAIIVNDKVSKDKLRNISLAICHNENDALFYSTICDIFQINPSNEEVQKLVTAQHPSEVVAIVFISFKFNIDKTKEYLKSNDKL